MTQGYQLDHSLSKRLSKHFFDNVLPEHVGLIMFSLLLSTCAEQVERVILSHFYSLSFLVRGLLHALKLCVGGVGGVVAHRILVIANFNFPFSDLTLTWLWPGTWPRACKFWCYSETRS